MDLYETLISIKLTFYYPVLVILYPVLKNNPKLAMIFYM